MVDVDATGAGWRGSAVLRCRQDLRPSTTPGTR